MAPPLEAEALVVCDALGSVDFWGGFGVLVVGVLVLFEVDAVFCALILAFKLAVYWLVLCTCLGVEVRFRDADDEDEPLLLLIILPEDEPLAVVSFEYLLAALLALVVVYCR